MVAAQRPAGGRLGTGNPGVSETQAHACYTRGHLQILPCFEKEVLGLWLFSEFPIIE